MPDTIITTDDSRSARVQRYSSAFNLFDAYEDARRNVGGTMAVMTLIVDEDRETDEGIAGTLERWLKADLEQLDAAHDALRTNLLGPLYAQAYPDGPPMSTTDDEAGNDEQEEE